MKEVEEEINAQNDKAANGESTWTEKLYNFSDKTMEEFKRTHEGKGSTIGRPDFFGIFESPIFGFLVVSLARPSKDLALDGHFPYWPGRFRP